MSFRLIIYRDYKFPPLEPDDVEQTVLSLPHTRRTAQEIREYTCDHPATGESFKFTLSRHTAPAYQLAVSGPTVDFSIDYSTSKLVVEDAMSTVFDLARRLSAKIHNLQEPKGLAEPESPRWLMNSFIKHRDAGIELAQVRHVSLGQVRITREKTDYAHTYLHWRETIEGGVVGMDAHVPEQVYPMRLLTGDTVALVIRWPDCIPIVFPEVDYVLVERDKKGLFGLTVGRDSGLVPFQQIVRLLGSDLMSVDQPIPHYVYRRPEPRPEVKKAADQLVLVPLASFAEPDWEDMVEV